MGIDINFKTEADFVVMAQNFIKGKKEPFGNLLAKKCKEYGARYITLPGDKYIVEICPSGNMFIRFSGGRITGESRTNYAGPGFHKFCVDFLESIAEELGQTLIVEDPTSYFFNRDFEKLKQFFHNWLSQLFTATQESTSDIIYISWHDKNGYPSIKSGVITPLGYYSKGKWLEFINKDINFTAAALFIWPHIQRDAYFYRNCGLYRLWNDVKFHKPRNSEELFFMQDALDNFIMATRLDNKIELPLDEWRECMEFANKPLLNWNLDLKYEIPVGYRKFDFKIYQGKFSFIIPGDFTIGKHEKDQPWNVYFDDERLIRISYSFECTKEFVWPEYPEAVGTVVEGSQKKISIENFGHTYAGEEIVIESKESKKFFMIKCRILNTETNYAVLAIITWSSENHTDWAYDTLLSFKLIK